MGINIEYMIIESNKVIEMRVGYAVANEEEALATVEWPIGKIISDEPNEIIAFIGALFYN